MAEALGVPVDRIRSVQREALERARLFVNSLYTVIVRPLQQKSGSEGFPDVVWLSVRRNDRESVRDWRHLQRIKNELVGPECEGIELFPAESRLVDTSNQYHLFVFSSPRVRFPFGFDDRLVMDKDPGKEGLTGTKQRSFE